MSRGRSYTSSVIGAYWMSWMRSFWKMTLPGVTARFRPISKAERSVWLMRSRSFDCSRSCTKCAMPCTKLAALVCSVVRTTSGLVSGKFDGENAASIWFR